MVLFHGFDSSVVFWLLTDQVANGRLKEFDRSGGSRGRLQVAFLEMKLTV